jgi:hypothetical protein
VVRTANNVTSRCRVGGASAVSPLLSARRVQLLPANCAEPTWRAYPNTTVSGVKSAPSPAAAVRAAAAEKTHGDQSRAVALRGGPPRWQP